MLAVVIIILVIIIAAIALVVLLLMKGRSPPSVMDNTLKKKVELKEALTDEEKRIVQNAFLVEAIRSVASKEPFDTEKLKADLTMGNRAFMYEDIKPQIKVALTGFFHAEDFFKILELNSVATIITDADAVSKFKNYLIAGMPVDATEAYALYVSKERFSGAGLKFYKQPILDIFRFIQRKDTSFKMLDVMCDDIRGADTSERVDAVRSAFSPWLNNLINYFGYDDYFFGEMMNRVFDGYKPLNNKLAKNYIAEFINQLKMINLPSDNPEKEEYDGYTKFYEDLLQTLKDARPSTHTFDPSDNSSRTLITWNDEIEAKMLALRRSYVADADGSAKKVGSIRQKFTMNRFW